MSNGLNSPGQLDSDSFRKSRPRKGGPRVMRLQQIATGGTVNPGRGGQPSVRTTEASTQAVIKAVYVQVLGNGGYAGERMSSDEARLENGDISLKDFVRAVAKSDAFRRRYWSGLYIVKAIEVMHRRLLGRPTFGRWEIDALFDTAARQGFYGVVDALIDSKDYSEAFGADTVPYERFITPGDVTARRTPGWSRALKLEAAADLTLSSRPETQRSEAFRSSGDVTPRNLPDTQKTATQDFTTTTSGNAGAPSWLSVVRQQRLASNRTGFPMRRASNSTPTSIGGRSWSVELISSNARSGQALPRMGMALVTEGAEGFRLRGGLPATLELKQPCSEDELQTAVNATYKQLLNRVPTGNERLISAESRLRNQDIDLTEFIAEVAMSEAFQNRIATMAPLRAASAAGLALLGRATTPAETSRFLITRAQAGHGAAVTELLAERISTTVPRVDGMATASGVNQATIQRTASLYRGNAGLTPPTGDAI